MHIDRCLWLMLAIGVVPIIGGCGSRDREWKWQQCYDGPRRPFSEISVLLIARDRLPLQVKSIDSDHVHDRTEYHVLPGDHLVVSEPDGNIPLALGMGCPGVTYTIKAERKGRIKAEEEATEVTLEPGIVYRLTAELIWEKEDDDHVIWRSGHSAWSPRVEALGSFKELRDALERQQAYPWPARGGKQGLPQADDIPWPYVKLGTGKQPPEHWTSKHRDKPEK